jgi:hypothetical protein
MPNVTIRYQTPMGATGMWAVDLEEDTDTCAAAFLKHWHPNYYYLGRDGHPDAPTVEADDTISDLLTVAAVEGLVESLAESRISTAVEPDEVVAPASNDFDGGMSGGAGADASFDGGNTDS